ncbi:MAG: hypothetical protein LC667_13415, partial [Thioalkalivibrio sp.]|nr:hypothetical protein [Thioalkalivibrio sp.]
MKLRTRTLNADGTTTAVEFDPWDRATAITTLTAEGETAGSETIDYTAAGRIEEITTVIDDSPTAGENRTTQFRWDGAGRTTRSATGERVSVSSFDLAGRLQSAAYGRGSIADLAETFSA